MLVRYSHTAVVENTFNVLKLTINGNFFEIDHSMLPKLSRVLSRVEKRLNNIGLMYFDFLYMFPTRILSENTFNRHSLLTDFDEITRVFIGKLGPTDCIPYETQYVSPLSDKSGQHFYFYLHSRTHKRGLGYVLTDT
jgi:hypothetical protein